MESQEKNKIIPIDKNEFGILSLIKENMLGACTHLMNEKECEEILQYKKLKGESFPYPLNFTPKDKDLVKGLKIGDKVKLKLDEKIIGYLQIQSKFKNNTQESIFSASTCSLDDKSEFCLGGEFEIYENPIRDLKKRFQQVKQSLNAKKITAIVSSFDPLHRAHERMLRWTIDKADLVVVFLIESFERDGFDFALKEKYLKNFIAKYFPQDRIFVFPLKDIDIFQAHLNPALECIIAKNLGCTKLVVGQNHSGLGMFYDGNQPKTILDEFSKNHEIEVIILPEFVFCDQCRMIVSTRSCPHGNHHHIHYNSSSIRNLLRAGLIPPAIFMRKEVSSTILSALFPRRLKNMQQIYYSLFPTDGILEKKTSEDFYQKLLELHQMSYMV